MKKLGKVYVFDGGMGTYYNELNKQDLPCELANINNPAQVLKIHKEYIAAGACAIKTNTFAANENTLNISREKVLEIISAAIKIAKDAVGDGEVDIFASIGPLVGNKQDNYSRYIEVIDRFLANGVSNFLFETFSSPDNLAELAKYIKSRSEKSYIITSFAISPQGETREGFLGDYLLKHLDKVEEIDALGFNCFLGPFHMKKYLEGINFPKKPLCIMPNSGYPTIIDNRTFYSKDPGYFANELREIVKMGTKIVGGCCGTTPKHIAKSVEILRGLEEVEFVHESGSKVIESEDVENKFFQALESGKKVIAVEYDPPEDLNMGKYIEGVKYLHSIGIDAVTIADCPVARARIDSSIAALKIKREVGIDPVVHLTCRDRNLNATKALIMGLNCEDILNLIVITGDPIPNAQRDEIKGVFNFNSIRLAGYVERLNREVLSKRMEIGAALNINAYNFQAELKKAVLKEQNGAKIFYTQPVLSKNAVENIKLANSTLKSYIMGGIIPVVSYRNAMFMNSEIAGITVSEEIIESYKDLEKEAAHHRAVELSVKYMKEIKDYVNGYYIITPFNNVKIVGKIVKEYKALI